MKVGMVSGKFDPPHDGHIDHIREAAKRCDYLLVVTHPDAVVAANSRKGKCAVPLWARRALLGGILLYYHIPGQVILSVDTDGGSLQTLCAFRPHIYCKGGDRSTAENMWPGEIDVCKELGIEIAYGVGRLLNSSSNIIQQNEQTKSPFKELTKGKMK